MLKIVLIGLVAFIGLVTVLGIVAPRDMKIEKSIVINQPKDKVFEYLRYLKNGSEWSPWEKKDPHMVKTCRGVDGQVGAVGAWSGNNEVGVGEQEIKAITEGQRIDTELRFQKPMKTTSQGYLITESLGEVQTKVTWGMTGRSSFPGNVICLVMHMNKKVGGEFESGLASLKTILEK